MKHENLKIAVVVCALITCLWLSGCNKPPEVVTPPDTGTVVPAQSKLLTAAINTGCTIAKAYIMVDNYLPFARPFIPTNIIGTAIPVLNTLHSCLNLYMASVITWSDTKTAPTDFDQLKTNLLAVKDEAMPLIQQIIALVNKTKADDAVVTKGMALKATIEEKAMFACTIDEFKAFAIQVKELPIIS